jgi:hypothetical protein
MAKASNRARTREVLTSGGTEETDGWYTPTRVLDVVRKVGVIGLDPFWAPDCHVQPLLGLTKAQDGLKRDWLELVKWLVARHRLMETPIVFCNPPYSAMDVCSEKIVSEARRGCEVVSLVKAATDTEWFERMVWLSARAQCFVRGRLSHTNGKRVRSVTSIALPKGPATFASVLTYHGVRVRRFAVHAAQLGRLVVMNGGA